MTTNLPAVPKNLTPAALIDPEGKQFTLVGLSRYELRAIYMQTLVHNDGYLFHEKYKITVGAVTRFANDPEIFALTLNLPAALGNDDGDFGLKRIRIHRGSALADVEYSSLPGFGGVREMPDVDPQRITYIDRPFDEMINGENRYHGVAPRAPAALGAPRQSLTKRAGELRGSHNE